MSPAPPAGAWRVHALLLGVMLTWGLNIPAIKALGPRLDEIWIAALRMLVACAVLTACVLARDRRLPRIGRRELPGLVAAALLMVYANQLLLVRGMHLSTATGASLVMGLMPALSAVVAAIAFRDRVSGRQLAGLLCGFAGVAAVVLTQPGAQGVSAGAGEAVILAALLTFVVGGALVQRLASRLDALTIGWFVYSLGSAALLLQAVATGHAADFHPFAMDGFTWALALYSGVFGTALSNVGWYRGIARIGMARAAVYLSLLPVFGVAFSAWTLGEPLTAWHAAGVLLVIAAIRMGTRH